MKFKINYKGKLLVFSFALMGCLSLLAPKTLAAQPYSSYWFPNDLKTWTPANDKDAKFNKGTIPLAKRFKSDKMNKTASDKPNVMALSIMNPSTSGTPSQGSNKFDSYTFSYWQYVDTLVYWGGSSGEGLIVPPSADVIDSSHKNGVPVLGTVFLPPYNFGGKDEWVRDLIQKDENGNFPVADKLIEVANYYGFDGWFINEETGTFLEKQPRTINEKDAELMQEFLKYLQDKKSPNMKIVWYDAMDKDGYVAWNNMLTDLNKPFLGTPDKKLSDSMFLNFFWNHEGWYLRNKEIHLTNGKELEASNKLATEMGRSPYDLYAGIDVQANGFNTDVNWNSIFPNNSGENAFVSLGLYCPNWTFSDSKSLDEYMTKENRFWVSESGDPRNTATESKWSGISNYVVEKSSIDALPFATNFNMGNGKFFNIDGKTVTKTPWNNRSLQDVMPTWRWIIDNNENTLTPSIDFDSAYYGGTSLKVSGDLKANNESLLKLYKTDLTIDSNTKLTLVHKANNEGNIVNVALTFDGDKDTHYLPLETSSNKDWNKTELSLKEFNGKKLTSISLSFKNDKDVQGYIANIGRLMIDNTYSEKISNVSNLNIEGNDFRDGIYADARLTWNKVDNADHYEIFRLKPTGEKEFLGATPNNCYYVQEMRRMNKENFTVLQVVPITKTYNRGAEETVLFSWPEYPKPIASFVSDKTLIAPGDKITFKSTSSEVTENVLWKFEGASVETSTDINPTVTYNNQGTFKVSLTAKNSSGDNEVIKTSYITVSKDVKDGVKSLSLNKKATADGSTGDKEKPDFALDGDDKTKWCAVGNGPHWLKVDLGSNMSISGFELRNAKIGGESSTFNTKAYRVEVSNDDKNWENVLTVTNNSQDISKECIPVISARYVKLIVDKPTQGGDTAARIYGFDVLGLPTEKINITDNGSTPSIPSTPSTKLKDVLRISGKSRIETSIEAAKSFKTSENVILVNGLSYADSITSTPLAKQLGAPILLTMNGNKLEQNVLDTISSLGAKNIYIIGGEKVVNKEIETSLSSSYKVNRLAGNGGRETTNAIVSKKVLELSGKKGAILINGFDGYADGLSVASIAAIKGYPILVCKNNEIPQEIKSILDELDEVLVVGGKNAISDKVVSSIKNGKRIASGNSRFETNLSLLDYFKKDLKFDAIYLATAGTNETQFVDGLIASSLASKLNAPVILTGLGANDTAIDNSLNYIKNNINGDVIIIGGQNVVPSTIEDKVNALKK